MKKEKKLVPEKAPQEEASNSSLSSAVLVQTKINSEPIIYNLPVKQDFLIGKSKESDLYLSGEDVSDMHAKIQLEKDGYTLYDLASDTGVTVNWEKISKHRLEHRDRIKIGSHVLFFEFIEKEDDIFDGMEKRRTTRIRELMTMQFAVYSGSSSEESMGIVKDISLDGAKIETEKEVAKNNIIEAGITSEKLPLVELIAQIIWRRVKERDDKKLYEVGIQFLEMDKESRDRLRNYIVRCMS